MQLDSLAFLESSYGFQTAAGTLTLIVMVFVVILCGRLIYLGEKRYAFLAVVSFVIWAFVTISVLMLRGYEQPKYTYVPGEYVFVDVMGRIPAEGYVVICVTAIIADFWLMYLISRYNSTHISRSSIPEALNNLKEGYRVSDRRGHILLENQMMKEINESLICVPDTERETLGGVIELEDGKSIELKIKPLSEDDGYTETIAADVTELVRENALLKEKNSELVRIRRQLDKTLLEELEAEYERERLDVKMKIHERFGQTLLNGQLSLKQGVKERSEALSMWDRTLKDFADTFSESADELAGLDELCSNVGCEVSFDFDRREAPETLIFALREAVINAVRHAQADELYVSRADERTSSGLRRYAVTSNGRKGITSVAEGGGLSSVRKRIESEGGRFLVTADGSVRLEIEL